MYSFQAMICVFESNRKKYRHYCVQGSNRVNRFPLFRFVRLKQASWHFG